MDSAEANHAPACGEGGAAIQPAGASVAVEYGDAISHEAFERALAIAEALTRKDSRPPSAIAAEAVSQAFCVCVVDGEDAAEGRLSAVHRNLIENVVARLNLVGVSHLSHSTVSSGCE
jgi:hypothetical protein